MNNLTKEDRLKIQELSNKLKKDDFNKSTNKYSFRFLCKMISLDKRINLSTEEKIVSLENCINHMHEVLPPRMGEYYVFCHYAKGDNISRKEEQKYEELEQLYRFSSKYTTDIGILIKIYKMKNRNLEILEKELKELEFEKFKKIYAGYEKDDYFHLTKEYNYRADQYMQYEQNKLIELYKL